MEHVLLIILYTTVLFEFLKLCHNQHPPNPCQFTGRVKTKNRKTERKKNPRKTDKGFLKLERRILRAPQGCQLSTGCSLGEVTFPSAFQGEEDCSAETAKQEHRGTDFKQGNLLRKKHQVWERQSS